MLGIVCSHGPRQTCLSSMSPPPILIHNLPLSHTHSSSRPADGQPAIWWRRTSIWRMVLVGSNERTHWKNERTFLSFQDIVVKKSKRKVQNNRLSLPIGALLSFCSPQARVIRLLEEENKRRECGFTSRWFMNPCKALFSRVFLRGIQNEWSCLMSVKRPFFFSRRRLHLSS